MFFHEICEIFKNTYSFKLYLVDLTVCPDLKFETGKNQAFYNSIYIKIFTFLLSHFFFPVLSSSKITELCFFHAFSIDFNSNMFQRSFSDLNNLMRILREYYQNILILLWEQTNNFMKNYKIFFWDYSKRSHQSDYIYYHKNIRVNKLISSVETRLYRPLYYVLNFTRSSHIVNFRMVLLSTYA